MVCAKDALCIYQGLLAGGLQAWLTGGWGIDALLQEQTRPHKDLDILLPLDDIVPMRELLSREGYRLKELWSENRWVVDSHGIETPTAFVLQDSEGREVDAHALCFDERGNGIPAWVDDEGRVFKREDLAGEGQIAGVAVGCVSAEMQVLCHTGYELPQVQRCDLDRLRERFGVELPDGASHLQPAGD